MRVWVTVAGVLVSLGGLFGPACGRRGETEANKPVEVRSRLADSRGDGTPDFLRLDDPADESAFRGWFTFLAETQFLRKAAELPREISDCAGLVRYSYREALRPHDGAWAAEVGLDTVPALPSVRKWRYPYTPLKAALFRIAPGPVGENDIRDGAFAEFADAETLLNYNTYPLGRDLARARPGDLLFYHQPGQRFPFHVMIYLGAGHYERGGEPLVVYHTGPGGDQAGEVRRPAVKELVRHPEPRWWPVVGNRQFLGVYRWNILGE